MTSVDSLHVTILPKFRDILGDLVALEEKIDLPIEISRIFVVSGSLGVTRGKHAHKRLTQVLVCVNGACVIVCDDGDEKKEFILDDIGQVLTIPPGIWAEQIYSKEKTVLIVLCDFPYDEDDYIRNYEEFIAFRREQK